jgi:hypothetical protein
MLGLVTEVFAQRDMGPPQPTGADGRNVILPPGDGNGNSGGNPGGIPWWLQPIGNIPIPGDGIGNPYGGNAGSGSSIRVTYRAENCVCEETQDRERYRDPNPIFGCSAPSASDAVIQAKVRYQFFYDAYVEASGVTPSRSHICAKGTIEKYTLLVWKWREQIYPLCDIKLPYMHLPYPEREQGVRNPTSGTFNANPSWYKQCEQ